MTKKGPHISISVTTQLKGLAILLVIVGHMIQRGILEIPYLIWGGQLGVTIFIILSGYGITKSYMHNGLDNFFFKRFDKVIFPYFLVTLLWVIIDIFIFEKEFNQFDIILALIGLDLNRAIDPSMWYITYSVLWYGMFFLVFSLPIKNSIKITILIYFSYIILFHYPQLEFLNAMSYQFGLYAFMFPMGIFLGLYYDKLVDKCKKNSAIYILISVSSLCLLYYFSTITPGIKDLPPYKYHINNIFWGIGIIGLLVTVGYFGFKSKILTVIGNYSYELYLFEFVFLFKYDVFKYFGSYVGFIIYLLLLIGLSIALKRILPKIKKIVFSTDDNLIIRRKLELSNEINESK
ncbi:acyltransferase [Neobacillus niacini]|uniref:acyltransferase family protein n=1 Tax=Neobacillus niacini TaxID=86668 RepID=UPI002FFDBC48